MRLPHFLEVARDDRQKGDRRTYPKEVTDTVSVIAEISEKSITTMFNTISILKLSDEIQMAIRNEGG
ncbi:MAG: hypothetical protein NTX36_10580 [Proteobacteria bacterium]|nr:hypothetical protein [Pseudomonadota bacterium]